MDHVVLGFRRVVGCRRDQGKRIVEMCNLGQMLPQQPPHLAISLPIPDRAGGDLQIAHAGDCVVVKEVFDHFMAEFLEHSNF